MNPLKYMLQKLATAEQVAAADIHALYLRLDQAAQADLRELIARDMGVMVKHPVLYSAAYFGAGVLAMAAVVLF